MSWFSRKIEVTFIDDATGAAFASSKMSADDLRETFAINTTLHLGDDEWSVIHADPTTRTEMAKSGRVALRLRRVELVDPKAISFSQLDITERIDDNENLGADEWIATTPLNTTIEDPESAGLPSPDVDSDDVYRVACTGAGVASRS